MAVCMGANPQGLEYGLHYSQMIESYMVPSHSASEDSADSLIPYAYAGYMEVT